MKPKERKARVLKVLARTGQSQNGLAREMGITPAYFSMILAGERRPSLPVAIKLEQFTGIPAEEFAEAS